jgi:hypothetical protein
MFPVKPSSTSTVSGGLATQSVGPDSAMLAMLAASESSPFAKLMK